VLNGYFESGRVYLPSQQYIYVSFRLKKKNTMIDDSLYYIIIICDEHFLNDAEYVRVNTVVVVQRCDVESINSKIDNQAKMLLIYQ